jgi:hypothetical protein
MSLEAYFTQVRQRMQGVPAAHVEQYEEQALSTNRGNCSKLEVTTTKAL